MRRYLIVDDNREFAENLAEILRDAGDEVAIAVNGQEALELAQGTRFDALLTDMRMPLMGGAGGGGARPPPEPPAAAQVVNPHWGLPLWGGGVLGPPPRRLDPGAAAMVITAHVADDALEAARREGLLAVLSKPVAVGRLLDLLSVARRDGLVAVVEDDPRMSDNLCEALRGRGFAAVTAASVLETERLGPVEPFCALVDLRVPGGVDGEAMRRLGERFPGLPMIVVTGVPEVPALPHEGYFTKPFDTAALLSAVERLHGRRGEAVARE
ncbi:response regulator [Anaeromyxobacter terrae]|uniref:response regulator n=1 Tax=Anaeromyxobacter terrae TaxID=2925406 RepID=UPI001F587384|nr:response regulator [Anaeromyxobacter sp. SG22]